MYTFVIFLYALIVRLIAPFHKKAGKMVAGQRNTFAILNRRLRPDVRYIWIHAASLGEFEQGRPLMERIKKRFPEYGILLTFFSPSGYEVRKDYDGADIVCYLPFDLPHNVRRFLQLVNPQMAIFIKYEFWMNYLTALHKRQAQVYIISAIFRPRQIFFKWYARRYKSVLNTFNRLYVQDAASAGLLAKNNVRNVVVAGDTRFDRVLDIHAQAKALPLLKTFTTAGNGESVFTLVAGSSWPEDEKIFIPYFNQTPAMKLIIAPHEIDAAHLREIISLLKRPYVLYTEADDESVREADCLIINCFGLLSSAYRYGSVAYVGGGFGVGIHNIPEAAVYGVPVIFGTNFHKFREAWGLIDAGGGFSINDASEFYTKMQLFAHSPDDLKAAGNNAGRYVNDNGGATDLVFQDIFGGE
jgi:3-deoxy-D-manno-octulosonic-acid transferase